MINSIHIATSIAAIALYLCGAAYLVISARRQCPPAPHWVRAFAVAALAFHAAGCYPMLVYSNGLNLSFLNVATLIFWVINVLVLSSGLKKPLHTLFIFLFPLSALALLLALTRHDRALVTPISGPMMIHILLSILAYSLLFIATLQAVLLAFQNYQLKHKHPSGSIRLLPPLQTMEALFFEILWAGQILLTLSIITGFLFIDDLFAQHLVHKTTLTLLAWCIYAILLWGRVVRGWRGFTAIRWALGGFSALMLAYFGSKFVLEFLLR